MATTYCERLLLLLMCPPRSLPTSLAGPGLPGVPSARANDALLTTNASAAASVTAVRIGFSFRQEFNVACYSAF
jgi:hypothetical protein